MSNTNKEFLKQQYELEVNRIMARLVANLPISLLLKSEKVEFSKDLSKSIEEIKSIFEKMKGGEQ